LSALRQAGATIGVAILGTLISNAYTAGVPRSGLPSSLAVLAHSSVTGGVQVAHALRSAALLGEVRASFVHGMDIMLWTCGGIALAAALLALAFLPRRPEAAGASAQPGRQADLPAAAGVADLAADAREEAESQL
jgi:hypothetical protein